MLALTAQQPAFTVSSPLRTARETFDCLACVVGVVGVWEFWGKMNGVLCVKDVLHVGGLTLRGVGSKGANIIKGGSEKKHTTDVVSCQV